MAFDLAIIGSGGGAFAAAIAARREDRAVVMIERGTVGGTCVNTGCVPSKALLAAAEARHVALSAERFPGLRASADEVALAELIEGKADLVAGMQQDKYIGLAAEYGWEIITGQARFIDGPALEVSVADGGTRRIEAEHYLIATGSAPWTPPVDGLAEVGYLTSTTAMELKTLPESMLVVGGNYVGLEQAQLFSRLGARIDVVEMEDRLAPAEEPEISHALVHVFAGTGICVHAGTVLTRVRLENGQVVADLRDSHGHTRQLRADELLMATGRKPVTDGLGLDAVGVTIGERGQIVTDEQLRTDTPSIWAAGDVTGHPQFVYVAGAHGAIVVDNAFHQAGRTPDYHHLPRVTFTNPQIAAAGLTDAEAQAQGYDVECRVLPLEHVPRALVDRDTRGLVKLVAERDTGRLLGAHVLADGAGDVIAAAVYALHNQMSVDEIGELWCPYLTMAEALKLAAQTFTRDVAKLSCCAA
ncbi:mercury(II) reductase [Prauserella muralis]|uniref:Mercuric reductase n=1 Tax=Prauserella muralis TaxID=588067 RepID=A0A2V4B1T1_9PSEU|nr:mercury(II) reductase [Prauserella muralis]PXY28240.1 mercury(II) reductase [Prauserella muralis]TWE27407.1 mercuric reductase [Prauserella muralis]